MPVHKIIVNGKEGYQWGRTGKKYFGRGARRKAELQGYAIEKSGYSEDNKKRKRK